MTRRRRSQQFGGAAPKDLQVRAFDGLDGRRYATLWFSRRSPGAAKLTAAEREVAEMVLAGLSNAAIATTRQVALSTVAKQVRNVFVKLGVSSRAELVPR